MLLETSLGRLFVDVRGDGPPLCLWHSFLCDGTMWGFQVPELEKNYQTINIDGPGHGRSEPMHHAFTIEDCAKAAIEVMDALDIESAHWAGRSWGGGVGMRVALANPERLRSLTLMAATARRETRRKRIENRAMASFARRFGARTPLINQIEPLFFAPQTREHHREIVDPFREHLAQMDPKSIGHAADAIAVHRTDIRQRIREIQTPTLVVVGDEDTAVSPENSDEIAHLIPDAQLAVLPAAGHLLTLDQPAQATEVLLGFLGTLETPPDSN